MFYGDPWYWFVKTLARIFAFELSGGLTIIGLENLPLEGPVIVAPNHLSYFDPPIVAATVPRKVAFMAKEELFRVPVIGWIVKSLNSFPVRRGEGDTEAIRETLERLAAGKLVLVFPEGTRGNGRELGPFNRGVAMLAKRSGAAVVPVGISGTERKLGKSASNPKWAHSTIVFGQPLFYKDFDDRDGFTQALRAAVHAACLRAGLPLTDAPDIPETTPDDPPAAPTEATSP